LRDIVGWDGSVSVFRGGMISYVVWLRRNGITLFLFGGAGGSDRGTWWKEENKVQRERNEQV
jgi:hypothetical protein